MSIQGIFVGLSTIDLVYEVNEFASPNSKVNARSQGASVGAPATNAAITFSNLGGEAALVTGIGRHRFGDLVREEINSYSVTLRDIAPEFEGVLVVSSVTIDNAGRRSVVSANANRISVQHNEVDRELLAISAGAEPIRLANAENAGAIPVPRVDAVDTNGAGDVLHGAYCYYAGLGMSFPPALEKAASIASESVRF